MMKTKSMSSKADALDGYLKYAGRKEFKEVLKMAEIENVGEDVRRRRWKFIGHIMRKELQNDWSSGPQRGGENREDQGQHGEGRRREKGRKWDGKTGARYKW